MLFRENRRHADPTRPRRKLYSERGRWELVVERVPNGIFLDLWWAEWPYAPVVGYCASTEPGGAERAIEALVQALESVPENVNGWDVELYLPPSDDSHPVLDPRALSALPRFTRNAAEPAFGG